MRFYSNFRYQYTDYSNTIDKAIKKANQSISIIYSANDGNHSPIRVIINGRVYMRKHWVKLGYKNPRAFISSKLNLI